MIAFYAWTNTLLLNAVRVKCGLYPGEEADLIVLCLDRVSDSYLDEIERSGVFSHIVRLCEPMQKEPAVIRKATKLFRREMFYRGLARQLSCIQDRCYRLLFTGGFWSYSLFVFRYLLQRSPDIELAFLEEGAASYNGLDTLLRCDPLGRKRSELYRRFYYSDIYPLACRAVKSLYLFCPEASLHHGDLSCLPIPPASPPLEALIDRIGNGCPLEEYRRRSVFFFLQPEPEADLAVTLGNIRTAVDLFGTDAILIKPHPSQSEKDYSWLSSASDDIFIDRSQLPFSCLVEKINCSDKLMIAKGTSCLLYPFYICRQQPTVLFTYDMYPSDPERDVPAALAKRLREMYTYKSRVMTVGAPDAFFACVSAFAQNLSKGVENQS